MLKFRYILFVLFLLGASLLFYSTSTFQFSKTPQTIGGITGSEEGENDKKVGIFTGRPCTNASLRPFAVMLAGDPEARPLAGIGSAEIVIEIPVVAGGITRYLAFYQCNEPKEIGSVRSSRTPFIGIAKGYGAIFAHWGGEKDALDKLRRGAIDNIDALPNPANAFWRKQGVSMPHDGFTSFSRLLRAAEKLTYNLQLTTNDFFTFKKHSTISKNSNNSNVSNILDKIITVGYPGKFQVSYKYAPDANSYLRFKGGTPEIDILTKKQVETKNVLILWARVYPTYSQYDEVELDGREGRLEAFIGGRDIRGSWRKEGFSKPLIFFDEKGSPLELEPGNMWVQVLGLEQDIEVIQL